MSRDDEQRRDPDVHEHDHGHYVDAEYEQDETTRHHDVEPGKYTDVDHENDDNTESNGNEGDH